MDKLKKVEQKLENMVRVQKQLEKKRKKLVKAAAKTKKQAAVKKKHLTAKGAEAAKVSAKKKTLRCFVIRALLLAALSTVVAIVVSAAIKRLSVQKNAVDRAASMDADVLADTALSTDYEKASLDELEEALLRVENQLDEVTEAIENAKK